MSPLSPSAIIDLWEQGIPLHPVDRGLCVLSALYPSECWQDLANLTVGERDATLLALRRDMFGDRLQGRGGCPSCNAEVEFELSVNGLLETGPTERPGEFAPKDKSLPNFRLPNSFDLAAVAHAMDEREARRTLAQRCVLRPQEQENKALDCDTGLDDETIDALSQAMEDRDPLADICLNLVCPACEKAWQATLDILSWFWEELSEEAGRLLGEVHLLARAYGWSEGAIISMSPSRRKLYVEMIL